MGSHTALAKAVGNSLELEYTKDGHTIVSNMVFKDTIEISVQQLISDLTRHIVKEVGDGTTSAVILSRNIFDELYHSNSISLGASPTSIIESFNTIVSSLKDIIEKKSRECTIDDIYNISMISTNGNKEVSENIKNIYEKYGMNVELSVGISNSTDSLLKVYDGLTITEGMSDPVYINNKAENTCEIHDAHIYHFADPIDTMDQIVLFESIITHNIYEPIQNDESPIPTVITCPRLSADMSSILKRLAEQLYQFDNNNAQSAKPPILVITDVVASDEVIMDDIANLCGCKTIHKYIDAEVYKKDIENGIAPTVDTVMDFCGHAELVVSDIKKTKFINPDHMVEKENGEKDPMYTAMVNFLENEIAQEEGKESAKSLGLLKKRLSALKANMVDYLVGGVTISERDMTKDLVEDAIKNCKASALYGVGYAANFEGLKNSYLVCNKYKEGSIEEAIAKCIFVAYCNITNILYGTVELNQNIVFEYTLHSIENGMPYDISNGYLPSLSEKSDNVLCSIKLDINILDTVSKIITMMATCNQCLLQSPHLNKY